VIGDELILVLAIVGLYLYDSVLMLAPDEGVLVQARGSKEGSWRAGFGVQNYKLAGREPYLPSPLAPHRRLYRLRWSATAEGMPDAPFIASLDNDVHFAWLRWCTLLMAGALFLLLPLGLLSRVGLEIAAAGLLVFYASALAAVWHVHRNLAAFGISKAVFVTIAVQCVACPPFGLNIVRKLCAATKPSADLIATAALLLRPEELEEMRRQCRSRLDELIELGEEGTPQSLAMIEQRARLAPSEEVIQ
jgi:hypothetical protein